MDTWIRLAVGVVVLLAVAAVVGRRARLGVGRDQVTATARAVVQLAVVALALRGVFAAPGFVVVVLAVMLTTAIVTAARRLRGTERAWPAVAIGCVSGSAVTVAIIVGLPALHRDVRTLVAVSGIVVGATMTAATLAGRHLREGLLQRRSSNSSCSSDCCAPRSSRRRSW